jgi:hypothetical protein
MLDDHEEQSQVRKVETSDPGLHFVNSEGSCRAIQIVQPLDGFYDELVRHWTLLIWAGFVTGVMNALAGGGSFVSLPALIGAGVPSVQANAPGAVDSPAIAHSSPETKRAEPSKTTRLAKSFFTTKDQTTIFYKDWGPRDAQPICFHHGWPTSSDDWDKGYSHGMALTHADVINADLLAFIRG